MSATEFSVDLPDEAHTRALAALLARVVGPGSELHLDGPLAAGKTAFARGFLHALGHRGKVKSPTFTLVESYELVPDGTSCTVHHFDLYRLEDEEELDFIGFDDYRRPDAILLIEWPSRAASRLSPAVVVELAVTEPESRRATVRLLAPEVRARAVEFALLLNSINDLAQKLS